MQDDQQAPCHRGGGGIFVFTFNAVRDKSGRNGAAVAAAD
jgi:hypothetical protein